MNISRKLSAFVSGLQYDALPESVKAQVNLRITDYIASAAAGWKVNQAMNRTVLEVIREQGGRDQSTLLFTGEKTSASLAAWFNAFVCNGADMDDGHMLANGHPGVCVIPGVLALAEWRKISYPEMAAAIVAGYEVFIRLAGGMAPSHLKRGFNGTGTSGTVAAAAACARALGLGEAQTHAALGLAATSASGLMELNETGQAMKPINPAKSAYNGLMCALYAEKGAVGPEAPLDGKKGYLRAFADEVDEASMTEGLGREYRMDSTYIKLYPACRHMHAMVDCGALLKDRTPGNPGEIAAIRLYTYPASEKLTGSIRIPKSEDEAKFSLTYAAAVALRTGGFALEDLYAAADMSPDIRALIDRMEIMVDETLEDRKRMLRGGRMEIEKTDGTLLKAEVPVPKGEKSYPLAEGDLRRKLSACAGGLLSEERQEILYSRIMGLRDSRDISRIYEMTIPEDQTR